MGRVGASHLLIVVAIVLFVLAGLGVDIGALTALREVAFGLAAVAAVNLVP